MRAVIYTRASLDRTGEGKSNARQREECERLCEYKRWEVVSVQEDISISAYGLKDRPAWNQVLALIEAGEIDVVVAYHLDRLTRNMADLEKLILLCEEHKVTVATATGDLDLTNDTGRMVARILAAVARQEVERKAARQRLAHAQRRAEGRPWAAVKMLGYERDGTVVEHEAEAIRQAVKDVIAQRVSLSELGRRWHAAGLTSPYKDDEKAWTPRGVKKVLTNPRLAGLITHDGEVLGQGNWTPIISEEDLTVVTAVLASPERLSGNHSRGRKAANLLTGIMRCAKCDSTVRAGSAHGKMPTYVCSKWCAAVSRAEADELVRSAFAATVALTLPGTVLPLSRGAEGLNVADELMALKEREEILTMAFARGVATKDAYESGVASIAAQMAALEAQSTEIQPADLSAFNAEQVRDFLNKDMHEQRRMLERLAVIKLHPGARHKAGARLQVEVHVKGKRKDREIVIPAYIPNGLSAFNRIPSQPQEGRSNADS